jgi:hypothetical protein
MKSAIAILVCFLAMLSGFTAEPGKDEGWSPTVNGLRARLSFGLGTMFDGTRLPDVFLELENVSKVGIPVLLMFDPAKSIRFDFRTKDVKAAPIPPSIPIGGRVFDEMALVIPQGGALRFPVTWDGYGVPRDAGTMFGFQGGRVWVMSNTDQTDYFLSAVLEVPPSVGGGPVKWAGKLEIPAAKAPTKK